MWCHTIDSDNTNYPLVQHDTFSINIPHKKRIFGKNLYFDYLTISIKTVIRWSNLR